MSDTKKKIVELDLNDVLPNRFQPRIKFTEDSIIELSDSIKTHGLLQPIIVRPIGDKYEIIAGERRYKACVLAGLDTISSIIIDYNDKDSAEVALIENVQRRDLTPVEEAISYKKILDMGYLTQEQLAVKLGKSQSSIANKIRLLNLCDDVQEALMEEKISERHARSLLKLKSIDQQRYMLKRIIKERLTVRKVDDEIQKVLDGDITIKVSEEDNDSLDDKRVILNNEENDDRLQKESNDIAISDDEITDITDLFDEAKLDEFLSKISLSDNEILSNDENKKEENDKMMNDSNFDNRPTQSSGRFFNIPTDGNDNSSDSIFGLSNNSQPVVSSKIDELLMPQSKGSNIDLNSQNSQDTIFQSFNSNLTSDNNNSVSPIEQNNSIFSNLLNSTSSNTQDDYVDKETFGKFLDPAYVDGAKKDDSSVSDSTIDNSVFAKFLDPNYDAKNDNSATENNSMDSSNNFNSIFNSSMDNSLNIKPSIKDEQSIPVDLFQSRSNVINEFSPEEQLESFNSNTKQNSAPDLLAPMSSDEKIDVPNLFEKPSIKEEPNNSMFASVDLTPDKTIFNIPKDEPDEIVMTTPVVNESPIFVTASTPTPNNNMPNNPIIDNPDISKLLSINTESQMPVEPIVESESFPTTIAETINTEPEIQVTGPIGNQPIIVTDYNKQYDPIFPDSPASKEAIVDFRQIINMIRELSDKIENYGYVIDTDEIDLVDKYQVIFNINKQ